MLNRLVAVTLFLVGAILALGFALTLSSSGSHQHPDCRSESQREAAAHQRGARPAPTVGEDESPRVADTQGEQKANSSEVQAGEFGCFLGRKLKVTDFWIAAFTLVLAIATILQFCALILTIRSDEDRIRTLERARIFPAVTHEVLTSAGAQFYPDQATYNMDAQLQMENFGRTPAIIEEHRSQFFVGQAGDVGPERFSAHWPVLLGYEIVYPQKRSGARTRTHLMDHAEFMEISGRSQRQDARRLFLFGYVVYRDIFGVKRRRRFCLKAVPQPAGFVFKPRGPYNGEEEIKESNEEPE